ncbi:hypothetical protein ACPXCG_22015 [Gordonia sp. DT218]|uniref:hypothetical protein n=1 Tax=unclassified Gordonia (in: high G+C Gram-positive bacteria) TaxID=2657482 RepID=UPI003CE94027
MPFSDDDLDAFYRDIEARTAASPPRRRRRIGVDRRGVPACPTPEKDAFAAEMPARDSIARIRHRIPPDVTLRCYECVCGAWHITSRSPR